jgi:lipopolysaccharide transport system ATP-binding protein
MKDVSEKDGRTILFVSHNMDAIARLCNTGLYMRNGRIDAADRIENIIAHYLQSEKTVSASVTYAEGERPGDNEVRLVKAEVIGTDHESAINFGLNEPVGIKIYFEVLRQTDDLVCGFNLYTYRDVHILTSHDTVNNGKRYEPGLYTTVVWVPANLLAEGLHYCGVAIMGYRPFTIHLHDVNRLSFNIVDTNATDLIRAQYSGSLPGVVRPALNWDEVTAVTQTIL